LLEQEKFIEECKELEVPDEVDYLIVGNNAAAQDIKQNPQTTRDTIVISNKF
jgi:hypothetical protein